MNEIQTLSGESLPNQPTIERDAKGNINIVQNGKIIGTVGNVKAKKYSYGQGLQNHFQQKRLAAIQAKQAKKQ